jgi:nitric oxide dioxygenase
MNERHIVLVQQSFASVAALGEQVADIFYGELFDIDPTLRPMFKNNMHDTGRKLLATLEFVVTSLDRPDQFIPTAQALAIKHVEYGVTARHYTLVGKALMRTLEKGLGADFTSDVRTAWIAAYQVLSDVMRQAAYGPLPARSL